MLVVSLSIAHACAPSIQRLATVINAPYPPPWLPPRCRPPPQPHLQIDDHAQQVDEQDDVGGGDAEAARALVGLAAPRVQVHHLQQRCASPQHNNLSQERVTSVGTTAQSNCHSVTL